MLEHLGVALSDPLHPHSSPEVFADPRGEVGGARNVGFEPDGALDQALVIELEVEVASVEESEEGRGALGALGDDQVEVSCLLEVAIPLEDDEVTYLTLLV